MAKKESIQEDQEFINTVEMFYPQLRADAVTKDPKWYRYGAPRYTKEWVIGVGAYLDLAHRVRNLEGAMKYGVSPTMQYMMKLLERYDERDSIPGAASAAYEWQSEVMRTMDTVTNMLNTFDGLETRLSCYVKLIEHSSELLKLARGMGNRHLRESVLTLHDALCGTYSEDLTIEQAEAIKDAVSRLKDVKWDRQMVRALDKTLRQQGFETVPSDRFIKVE